MRRLAVALSLLLAGCGGSGDGNDAPTARVVEVKALDTLRFDPATVSAKAGETVVFRVTNSGAQPHEFVVGDAAYHDAHEKALGTSASHGHHATGEGAAVTLDAGETKDLSYTMPSSAPTFACHLASHDDAGMKGTVTY